MTRTNGRSKVRGNWAEDILKPAFRQIPRCSVIKVDAPFKIMGYTKERGRKLAMGFPEEKAGSDFVGGFNGRHCEIEAKRHNGKERRWNFKSNIRQHQHERLSQSHAYGEIAAIILAWDVAGDTGPAPVRWFWVPYDCLRQRISMGTKSWTIEDIEELITPGPGGITEMHQGRLADCLSAVLAGEGEAMTGRAWAGLG